MSSFRGFIQYCGPSKRFEAGPGVSAGGKAPRKKNPALQATEPFTQGHDRSDGLSEAVITHTQPESENGNSHASDTAEQDDSTSAQCTQPADEASGTSADSPLLISDDEDYGEEVSDESKDNEFDMGNTTSDDKNDEANDADVWHIVGDEKDKEEDLFPSEGAIRCHRPPPPPTDGTIASSSLFSSSKHTPEPPILRQKRNLLSVNDQFSDIKVEDLTEKHHASPGSPRPRKQFKVTWDEPVANTSGEKDVNPRSEPTMVDKFVSVMRPQRQHKPSEQQPMSPLWPTHMNHASNDKRNDTADISKNEPSLSQGQTTGPQLGEPDTESTIPDSSTQHSEDDENDYGRGSTLSDHFLRLLQPQYCWARAYRPVEKYLVIIGASSDVSMFGIGTVSSIGVEELPDGSWRSSGLYNAPTRAPTTGISALICGKKTTVQLFEHDNGIWNSILASATRGLSEYVFVLAHGKVSHVEAKESMDGSWTSNKLCDPTPTAPPTGIVFVIHAMVSSVLLIEHYDGIWTCNRTERLSSKLSLTPLSTSRSEVRGDQGPERLPCRSRQQRLSHRSRGRYSKLEDTRLRKLKEEDGLPWNQIVSHFPRRTLDSLQKRYATMSEVVKGVESRMSTRAQAARVNQEPEEF
ncbi:MAG: hypothetical protein M1822_003790 [Bathelium mastoideum]|nr:MAG: hypothetical protein M1822_003790 [Bathelium mastoideum]